MKFNMIQEYRVRSHFFVLFITTGFIKGIFPLFCNFSKVDLKIFCWTRVLRFTIIITNSNPIEQAECLVRVVFNVWANETSMPILYLWTSGWHYLVAYLRNFFFPIFFFSNNRLKWKWLNQINGFVWLDSY